MSTTNTDPDRNSAKNSGGGQPTPGADSPAIPPSTCNSGKATEESNSPNKPHSDPGSPLNAPTTNATNPSPSSCYVRQCFLGGNSHWMKWEKLDIGTLEKDARSTGTYTGALLMTAAVVPVIAAFISAVVFIVQRPRGLDWLSLPGMPLLLGTVPTLIIWLLLAFLVRRLTAVDRMNMERYDLLFNRLSSLDAQLSILYPEPGETLAGTTKSDADAMSALPPLAVAVAMASKEVLDCRNSIYEKLRKKNLAWVTASGYINLWKENSRWEAIIHARNQLVSTMILTGLTIYVLLQFTILAGAQQATIISATAFFLVGALVGLFYRLYSESQTSKSIDDYRLALARLVAIPMFSGLAAVGGVLLTQKFTPTVNVFDPKNMLPELIVAAVFGLTPGLLFGMLQKQTEQYKIDLKSTEETQQGQK